MIRRKFPATGTYTVKKIVKTYFYFRRLTLFKSHLGMLILPVFLFLSSGFADWDKFDLDENIPVDRSQYTF
jgi:hypothetical protein